MKLILRSGGAIENRDPFKRSPVGLQTQWATRSFRWRFQAKDMITLGAVARSLHRANMAKKSTETE